MTQAEIGGIFDLDERRDCSERSETTAGLVLLSGNPTLALSGRTALDLILWEIGSECAPRNQHLRAYLPAYCCQSMIDPFVRRGFQVDFYPVYIDDAGRFTYDIDVDQVCEVFLATSYFGFSETAMDGWIKKFQQRGTVVVEDLTHRLFSVAGATGHADFEFASVRKWMGAPAGGFARRRGGTVRAPLRDAGQAAVVGERAMLLKSQYVVDDTSLDLKKEFLALQAQQSALLADDFHDRDIDQLSAAIARRANVEGIRAKRLANAHTLISGVAGCHSIEVPVRLDPALDGPLFVPIVVPKDRRGRILEEMREHGLYMPVHWPRPAGVRPSPPVNHLYDGEISLVCDQRYTPDDMVRIVDFLQKVSC